MDRRKLRQHRKHVADRDPKSVGQVLEGGLHGRAIKNTEEKPSSSKSRRKSADLLEERGKQVNFYMASKYELLYLTAYSLMGRVLPHLGLGI